MNNPLAEFAAYQIKSLLDYDSAEKSAGREFNSRPRLQNFLTYFLSISSLSHFPYPLCFSNGLCVHVPRCFEL